MALNASKGKKSSDQPDAGTYTARLVGLVDMGHQPGYEFRGEQVPSQYKVRFTYELGASRTTDDRPHWVSEEMKLSDHEASKMLKRINAMDPAGSISDKGQNLSGLIGVPCMVEVGTTDKGYAKVNNVSGVPGGIPVPELENEPMIFDMDEPDMKVWDRLPEFIQNNIKQGLEFEGSALHRELALTNDSSEY